MFSNKVKSLEELREIIISERIKGKKIVHCHGCFDVVHYGHLQHFLAAKKQGDILIVTVTPDKFINKGIGRPLFNESIRINHLAGLECINYVALNNWESAVETIRMLKPDVFAKGSEVVQNSEIDVITNNDGKQASNLSVEKEAIESIGGKIFLTDEITFSSSNVINELGAIFSSETRAFINELKSKHTSADITRAINELHGIRVLVIGDVILDEYIYCTDLDKAGKEPIVTYSLAGREIHAGGACAVANHLAQFTPHITLLTCIGGNNTRFVNESLSPKIEKKIITQKESKTIVKRRYINNYKKIKVFEITNSESLDLSPETENKLLDYLENNCKNFDVILVCDFGHGLMTPKLVDFVNKCQNFVAVNAQLNGANRGYNFITKYKKISFASLNEKEIRLPLQDRKSEINILMKRLSELLGAQQINVTLARTGSMYYENGKTFSAPAFNKNPVDTVGSGDAVLSITSLLAYKKVNPQIISFLANCVGALAVKIVGNRTPINKTELNKLLNYMLR